MPRYRIPAPQPETDRKNVRYADFLREASMPSSIRNKPAARMPHSCIQREPDAHAVSKMPMNTSSEARIPSKFLPKLNSLSFFGGGTGCGGGTGGCPFWGICGGICSGGGAAHVGGFGETGVVFGGFCISMIILQMFGQYRTKSVWRLCTVLPL